MAYIYENDVSRVGGNLQKTVAYLLSLHKAEYEWNLLGIKVVGHVDALPIPQGTYDYGDAYMVGTKTPYDMYVYTRADEFHTTAYWFDIGKFPQPGTPGPKGDGLDTITSINTGTPQSVVYDTTHGAVIDSNAKMTYKDSTTGKTKTQEFPMTTNLPIMPGKYISMDSSTTDDSLTVKVDDTALALDFYKADKSANTIPCVKDGVVTSLPWSKGDTNTDRVVVSNGIRVRAYYLETNQLIDPYNESNSATLQQLVDNTRYADYTIAATNSDTGTLTADQLTAIQELNRHIVYRNQVYYRMDPTSAPDGTLSYIHIDTLQSGGTYKATGKCFSVTVSTRAWQVVDLSFRTYTHNITVTDNVTNVKLYFTVTTTDSFSYAIEIPQLIIFLRNKHISGTMEKTSNPGAIYAASITASGSQLSVSYGDPVTPLSYTASQLTVEDAVI